MTAINPQAVRGPVTAVPVVAGTGVRFVEDVPNNRVVAELDETVLWEKTWSNAGGSAALSESANNFQLLRITFNIEGSTESYCPVCTTILDVEAMLANTSNRLFELTCIFSRSEGSNRYIVSRSALMQNDGTTLTVKTVDQSLNFGTGISSMNASACHIMKVVGINRVASA